MRSKRFIGTALLVAMLAASPAPALTGAMEMPPRVVLITIDTLRADHLPMYGYPRNTSPFLAKFAERGILYENFISASATTGPSHAAIFTSLFPDEHHLLMNGQPLATEPVTMAELFAQAGYATGAFTSVGFLADVTRGFEAVDVPPGKPSFPGDPISRRAGETIDKALHWIKGLPPEKKAFLWVHVFDVHGSTPDRDKEFAPWGRMVRQSTPEEKRRLMKNFWLERGIAKDRLDDGDFLQQNWSYDGRIRYTDAQIKRLVQILEAPDAPPVLWIITADHGEGLGEHGHVGHGVWIYEEQTHIPLIISFPDGRGAGKRVKGPASQLDLLPTISAILGRGAKKHWEGKPLWPVGSERASNDCFITRVPKYQKLNIPKRRYALRNERWKMLWSPSEGKDELYDLSTDPHELHNVADWNIAAADKVKKRLLGIVNRVNPTHDETTGNATINPSHVEELRSLGYLQ